MPTDLLRQEIAAAAHTVVVKIGTRSLTTSDGVLDQERIASLSGELHALTQLGKKVVLVSSGAVGSGMAILGLKKRPVDLAKLQAVAAVGQAHLIQSYDQALRKFGARAGQVLLTADDLNDRTRYLNVRNTLLSLLEYNAIPIINENDTVAVDELMTTFGDNDRLAAMVTNLIRAPLLVILSDIQGLYDGDPREEGTKLVHTVQKVDATVLGYVRDKLTGLSKGGMASKLNAARIVTTAGENMIIAYGRTPGALGAITAGEVIGTLFTAQGKTVSPLKRWIGFSARARGKLVLDAGARAAIVEKGRSLLAIGVRSVEGEFRKGDVVSLCEAGVGTAGGNEFARGLSNYASDDVQKIKGLKSDQIAEILGHRPYEEVIHRDNMVVTEG